MGKIKVMIAEDHKMFRDFLSKNLLEESNNIDIIGKAENGKVLLDLINNEIPDVVILDLSMPVMDGHTVLKIITKDFPSVRTIILSTDYTPFYVALVIMGGAAGYLDKGTDFSEVVKAIEEVYKDGYYFNELISKEILNELQSNKKIYYLIDNKRFSEREIQVLRQLCDDIPPGKIADNLHISENTARYHKKNLLEKTESETIISLVKYAIRQGIIKNDRF